MSNAIGSSWFHSRFVDAGKNVGDTPATYHVIKWNSPGMLKKKEAAKE
jgi:hypothetical protein